MKQVATLRFVKDRRRTAIMEGMGLKFTDFPGRKDGLFWLRSFRFITVWNVLAWKTSGTSDHRSITVWGISHGPGVGYRVYPDRLNPLTPSPITGCRAAFYATVSGLLPRICRRRCF